jgi:nucleoside-diphosphate-sugar epimerase
MRILVAGASGVLGRATLPHLRRNDVVALTRTRDKLQLLHDLGARGIVCNVYDYSDLLRATEAAKPQIVVNFLTDLATRSDEANNRVRREGTANLLHAATTVKASRFVVESVAFSLEGDAGRAVEQLERSACEFVGESLILRFGRLWGPGTWHRTPPESPTIPVERAGAEASRLLIEAPPGIYIVS